MQIIEYTHDEQYIKSYIDFIKQHYSKDKRVSSYISQIVKQLSKDNPFFGSGKLKNFLLRENGRVIGHCSAIIDKRNENKGLIGFYDCIENKDANNLLLDRVIEWLKKQGCSAIRGPVNLTIWHNYRFITKNKRNLEIFDPFNKDYYPRFWKNKGFSSVGKYVSATRQDPKYVLPYTKKAYEELSEHGFKIRCFNKENPTSDLKIILNLANKIFTDSWNFIPLTYDEFQYLYKDVLSIVDSDFIEIIEDKDSNPVGFCFSLPNPYNRTQLIIKTMGVLKEYRRQNIAAGMLYSQHLKGKEKGVKEFYYPLIRVGNNVTKFPYEGYDIITEYEVFELS